ncbi:MAG: Zinc ABC transporter, periplasmic-binding protein ZnuA [uncultured Sulfurovum sp.]|uniref:Zinc ABC transporter, periplasmic-binding protein ZnuA n=1 Tax=uncultured Sulfurovum sp. TaxID=269237 RepID=A0A6S6T455_9BACT|nr:MAG: Zinc ABC transporter, periplasmic-binding protein ZnuA [uncultured Sulfurovum sp.]
MKKYSLLLFFLTSLSFAKIEVAVSLAPQKVFVEKIGAEHVNVTVIVEKGSSPHDYQPKPSQMRDISKAMVYFAMGVEFENIWLYKFQNQNKNLLFIDSTKGMQKYQVKGNYVCTAGHTHTQEQLDPHVWVDPINVKIIAKNIYETLVSLDEKNKATYLKNYKAYLLELDALDTEIRAILKETPKKSTFMVFHPSWGYFAKRYDLTQLPVEIDGKEPKMKALVGIIEQAKKEKVHAIFTQPEFSDKASRNIANNLKIEVIKASPLAENWAENLKMLAKAIAQKK